MSALLEANDQEERHRLGRSRGRWKDVAIVIGLATAVRFVLLWGTGPVTYWDSKSYLSVARFILAHGRPPLLGMRPPGYPLFIVVSGGFGIHLKATVFFQHLLGIATVVLLFEILLMITKSRFAAFAGALVLMSMPDILFTELTIYAETLAIFLVALTTFLFVRFTISRPRPWQWAVLGAVAAYGAWTRPILQLLVVMLAICVFVAELWRQPIEPLVARVGGTVRPLLCFLLPPVLLIGGTILANGVFHNAYRLANGMGFSSLNAVGHPQIYRNLPPDLQWITRVYEEREALSEFGYVRWGLVLQPLLKARKQNGLSTADWDRAALNTFLTAVRACPTAYLGIWKRTFLAFWTRYNVLFGPWKTERDVSKTDHLQVVGWRWTITTILRKVWKRLQLLLSALFFLALPLVTMDPRWDRKRRLVLSWIWMTVLLSALANTAIESSVGQARYRMPWTVPILVVATAALFSLPGVLDRLRSRKTSLGGQVRR